MDEQLIGFNKMKEALIALIEEYESKGQLLGYDVDMARRALKEAGWDATDTLNENLQRRQDEKSRM